MHLPLLHCAAPTFLMILVSLCACSAHAPQNVETVEEMPGTDKAAAPSEDYHWQLLCERLAAEGLDTQKTAAAYARLQSAPSSVPMGMKVRELYSGKFLARQKGKPRSQTFQTRLGIPGPWFKGVVTQTNALRCRNFILENAEAFALAKTRYGVPPEIGAALLFVETRLGTYLGKQNAFFMLSSMAVTRQPEDIAETLEKLPGSSEHLAWIRQRMSIKADWAYGELVALIRYCQTNGIDPLDVPGSVYGAIGMCQFMPSNIPLYAVDGNDDGVVNLFQAADAIASLSNYLYRHGWKSGLDVAAQTKVIRSYNAMNIYARTILALARTIERLP